MRQGHSTEDHVNKGGKYVRSAKSILKVPIPRHLAAEEWLVVPSLEPIAVIVRAESYLTVALTGTKNDKSLSQGLV